MSPAVEVRCAGRARLDGAIEARLLRTREVKRVCVAVNRAAQLAGRPTLGARETQRSKCGFDEMPNECERIRNGGSVRVM